MWLATDNFSQRQYWRLSQPLASAPERLLELQGPVCQCRVGTSGPQVSQLALRLYVQGAELYLQFLKALPKFSPVSLL